jgi:DNA mismatch repair ATPase MutS
MRLSTLLALALAFAMSAQEPPDLPRHPRSMTDPDEDVRLPNGKLQKDEILKADFQKSLDEARELSKLADQLKADLEKNDRYVLSIPTLKKAEDIEKLAKRIHDRMKHY